MTRFSKDMDNIDRQIVRSIGMSLNYLFVALGGAFSVLTIVPYLVIVAVPLIGLAVLATRYFLKSRFAQIYR